MSKLQQRAEILQKNPEKEILVLARTQNRLPLGGIRELSITDVERMAVETLEQGSLVPCTPAVSFGRVFHSIGVGRCVEL
jgi:hypothetical protein